MQLTIIQIEREEFLHSRILERSDRIKSDWLQISNDLKEVKKDKLYLRKAKTFEEYCNVFLDFKKRMANQLISSSEVMENLNGHYSAQMPQTETQARPLTKLEPELQRETWSEVLQENQPEKITAKIIAEKVETKKELNEVVKEVKRENQPDTIFVQTPLTEKEILKRAKELKEERKQAYKIKLQAKIEKKAAQPLSDEEQTLLDRLKNGETVVINMNKHFAVLKWAKENNKYQQIDRYSDWGNPFNLDKDGNREEVCDAYEHHYLPHKKSLINKIQLLKGKALGCHCAPLRCHGHGIVNTIKRIDNV